MKLRTTTPASMSRTTRWGLMSLSLLVAVAVPLQLAQLTHADQYDSQINALQQQISSAQAQANQLGAQATTLQNAVTQLQLQVNDIQAQITLSQTQYDQLTSKIADTQKKIKDNQDALGQTFATMYVDSDVSPLEMLAGSKNIADYLDKQQYRTSVNDQLSSTIKTITALQTQLTQQQNDVKAVLDKQTAQKASLAATQSQQQDLLNQTQGQEAAYQQLVSSNQQKLSAVADQQKAYYQSLLRSSGGGNSGVVGSFQYSNWSGNQGCSGGYPYCGSLDSSIDPWALYNRECVSYVAWAISTRFGKYVSSFHGQGNAYQWPSSAPLYSGAVRVSDPQPGDAVILPQSGNFAPIGHAMVVESVNGSNIHVSQYNFYGTGEYSTMDIKNSGVIFLRFPSAS